MGSRVGGQPLSWDAGRFRLRLKQVRRHGAADLSGGRHVTPHMLSRTPGAAPEQVLSVNLDQIWWANVAATVELDRQVQRLEKRLAELEALVRSVISKN